MCAIFGLPGGVYWVAHGGSTKAPDKQRAEECSSGPLKRLMLRACQATGNAPVKYKHATAHRRAILRVPFSFFLGLPGPGFR